MKEKIFITGAGGCVGHYLLDLLAQNNNYSLYLLLRSPQNVKFNLNMPNINVIKDDFKKIKKYDEVIKASDYVIHLLADWGNEFGNYRETIDFFDCIDPSKIKKIIYFSTASILGQNNKPNPQVLSYGTGYIKGKFRMHQELEHSQLKDKIITLYPTLIFGGDKDHPYSHASKALMDAKKWLRFITFISCDLRFHYIHAKDIAKITVHLLANEINEKEFVLGGKAITAENFMDAVINYFGLRRPLRIKLTGSFANMLAWLFKNKLSEWNKYCLKTYHQEYKTVDPSHFGFQISYPSLKSIIEEIF